MMNYKKSKEVKIPEQNEDLAKLRAGVSLAKTGIQDAKIMIDD